jgi:hypothetical protein
LVFGKALPGLLQANLCQWGRGRLAASSSEAAPFCGWPHSFLAHHRHWSALQSVSSVASPELLALQLPLTCFVRQQNLPVRTTAAGSARCAEFKNKSGQVKALRILRDHRIEALVVIGGNGSQAGTHALSQRGFPVVGVASTIDNDLSGSEMTIGVDTALNIALEAWKRSTV